MKQSITITTNTRDKLVTEHTLGNVTTVTTLFAVEQEEGRIPMLGCEIDVYIDGTRNEGLHRKGYIMPFRRYCFSVQSSTADASAQLYMTGPMPQEVFADYISRDTFGDMFIIPNLVECVTAEGGRLDTRRLRGVSMALLQNFKAQVISWVMKKEWREMSTDQKKFVDEQLRPKKKSVEDFTPEELMAAVLKGEVKITF